MKKELDQLKALVDTVAGEVVARASGMKLDYLVGTMIELPRAAMTADKIAEAAEFFSLRHQRSDPDRIRPVARRCRRLPAARTSARTSSSATRSCRSTSRASARCVEIAVEKGRATRPDIKLGICGEHGGDPASVHFCASVGLDYVSCSPYRVPIARLAAAQAALESGHSVASTA